MANTSNNYKKTLMGSVGAGVGAVFNPGDRTYYILEHKVSTRYHKAGEWQEIIVDQIELGRDPSCQVRFDEQFDTVSRKHAAIVRDGENWKLIQLSKTNTTFLNGHPVKEEWYLQNGDEIQLSVNGPKLGFIVPSGNKSTVGSIGLSRRLSLFRQQALRPYRVVLWILALLLLLAIGLGGFFIWKGHKENTLLKQNSEQKMKEYEQMLIDSEKRHQQELDSLAGRYRSLEDDMRKIKKSATQTARPPRVKQDVDTSRMKGASEGGEAYVRELLSNAYFVMPVSYKISLSDGTEVVLSAGEKVAMGDDSLTVPLVSGTGFLLNNGVFVTTRKMIDPWLMNNDSLFIFMNLMSNAGATIEATLYCQSSSGDEFTISTDRFTCNRSGDVVEMTDDGISYTNAEYDYRSYAYARVELSGGLSYSSSYRPREGESLLLMGYTDGLDSMVGVTEAAVDGIHENYFVFSYADKDVNQLTLGSLLIAVVNGEARVIGMLKGVAPEKGMGLAFPISLMGF